MGGITTAIVINTNLKGVIIGFLLPMLIIFTNGCGPKVDYDQIREQRAAETKELMDSWLENHQSDLIASWGAPQQVMDDGLGGKVFIYSKSYSWTTPETSTTKVGNSFGKTTLKTRTTAGQTITSTTQYIFFINKESRIYRWSVK